MKFSSIARINFTNVMLGLTAVMAASMLGGGSDERTIQMDSRVRLAESIGSNLTFLVSQEQLLEAETQIQFFVDTNADLISIGVRDRQGRLLCDSGQHAEHWDAGLNQESDGCIVIPMTANQATWGSIELHFQPIYTGLHAWLNPGLLTLMLRVTPLFALISWLYLRKIFRYLDPAQAVPPRVRQALDSFSEGVVLLDPNHRIALANDAFADQLGVPVRDLLGTPIDKLQFALADDQQDRPFPWKEVERHGGQVSGVTLNLLDDHTGDARAIFSVNASPVLNEQDECQGTMVVFADVTQLEQKRQKLAITLDELSASKEEITKQNEELRYLATRDPLTSCVNRRTFYEQFSRWWRKADAGESRLTAMMVDIDFFKSINDTYGHSMGDEVLRETGRLLNELSCDSDIVCRYGGEEFAVLMPGRSLDEAAELAEQIRLALAALQFPEFTITASLGVSCHELGANDPPDLLDQADKCLYVAKRGGRNQVVRFDNVDPDVEVDESKISRTKPQATPPTKSIPYPAVAALLSALSYRDSQTGAHSTRVSTYAAQLAQHVVRPREVYDIEMAGLLHDIGKVGVPDAILLKPGPLTKQEWEVMHLHDRIGIEIVSKAFNHEGLTQMIQYHHARWDGDHEFEELAGGEAIPIGARILTITDAFDAMISDRPYRKGMPLDDAIAELNRGAGSQFDPQLVPLFVELVRDGKIRLQRDLGEYSDAFVLSIGEQVESLVDAIDQGDRAQVRAIAERLKGNAEQFDVAHLAGAASHVAEVSSEERQLTEIYEESLELLNICRAMHEGLARTDVQVQQLQSTATPTPVS